MSTTNAAGERGLSLIELIIAITVIGVAVVGVLGAISMASRASADPMIQKQALAIAEAFLEEAQLQPFTYCDPDDTNAATALGATGCAATVEGLGPEGEDRYSTTTPFDNVNDYSGFAMAGAGMTDITGATVPSLAAYSASVSISASTGELPNLLSNSDALRIVVTVTGPAGVSVVLQGYRLQYAPNQP